jgi:hypothetical protein
MTEQVGAKGGCSQRLVQTAHHYRALAGLFMVGGRVQH